MNYRIIINSYKRENKLFDLLCQLRGQKHREDSLDIHVYTDGCKYSPSTLHGVTHHEMEHHGREGYYKLVKQNFVDAATDPNWDRCIKLDDDMEIVPGFYEQLIPFFILFISPWFVLIVGPKKYNVGRNGREESEYITLYKTDWTDLNFIANREFITEAASISFQPSEIEHPAGSQAINQPHEGKWM